MPAIFAILQKRLQMNNAESFNSFSTANIWAHFNVKLWTLNRFYCKVFRWAFQCESIDPYKIYGFTSNRKCWNCHKNGYANSELKHQSETIMFNLHKIELENTVFHLIFTCCLSSQQLTVSSTKQREMLAHCLSSRYFICINVSMDDITSISFSKSVHLLITCEKSVSLHSDGDSNVYEYLWLNLCLTSLINVQLLGICALYTVQSNHSWPQ